MKYNNMREIGNNTGKKEKHQSKQFKQIKNINIPKKSSNIPQNRNMVI